MKKYLVVGMGVSGVAAAEVLRGRECRVVTVDDKKPADFTLADINNFQFDYSAFDGVITSPGFKPTTDFIVNARHAGVPVISDVELSWHMSGDATSRKQTWIGITGTNGKTTTTEMTAAIMQEAGRKAIAAGNIGYPITKAATDADIDTIVAELSSFQLHYTDGLELDSAAITNLADDHLDWHGGFEAYAADKAKIYRGAKKVAVFNADDARVTSLAAAARSQVAPGCTFVGFTLGKPAEGEIGVEDGWIVNRSDRKSVV